jgi:2-phospho-L-lactate/phosphoenolpyruvate guanylyltransferase
MQATVILPVKRFGDAKQRLLTALDRPQRAALVKAMLTDVLVSATDARDVERLIVVTSEGRAERIALSHARRTDTSIEVFEEPADHGHPEAATLGIVRAKALGASCVALLAGDCPLLDADELDAALERMRPGRIAVVPDRHGTGTNALLMSPPDAIGPAFGPGSCARHSERAERAGHEVAVEPLASLALDVDTLEDLQQMAVILESGPDRAPTTAEALTAIGDVASGARE